MKKIIINLSFFYLLAIYSNPILASCIADKDGFIEIDGQKKPMLGHINNLLFKPESKFKNTHVLTYSKGVFTVVGTVTNCSEEYIELIAKNNYTFFSYYNMVKVGPSYEKFSAIIVGHKNAKLKEALHLATMKEYIKNIN